MNKLVALGIAIVFNPHTEAASTFVQPPTDPIGFGASQQKAEHLGRRPNRLDYLHDVVTQIIATRPMTFVVVKSMDRRQLVVTVHVIFPFSNGSMGL